MNLLFSTRLPVWGSSVAASVFLAIESVVPYFLLIILVTILDIASAVSLARRLKRKHPCGNVSGKVESSKLEKSIWKIGYLFIVLLAASLVDHLLLGGGKVAVVTSMWLYLLTTAWSILENWSTENNSSTAKILQRVLIDKTSRHMGVDLSDLIGKEDDKCEQPKDGPLGQ